MTATEQLKADLIELKKIKESFPELLIESLKEILKEHGSAKVPENHVTTGNYRKYKKISEVSYNIATDKVLLDNEIDYRIQNIRKRFIIYLDVLDYFRIPADEISEIFRRYYNC